MKVLQINCVYMHGSTGRLVNQISTYLTHNGIDNYIAHGIPRIASEKNSYVINNSFDAHIHSFCSRKFCAQGLCSFTPTLRLISFIKKYNPDIVHLHNLHGHYLNYKLLFKYLSKSHHKVVWTFHDCWPMTGKCAHFTVAKCYKWSSEEGCDNCCQLNTYPDSELDRTNKNFVLKRKLFTSLKELHIVTVSEWLKTVCKDSYLKNYDIRCIHNGINTDIFKPGFEGVFSNIDDSKKKVLFVSNIWNGAKGDELIMQLDEKLPSDYVLIIVGKGSEKFSRSSKNNRIITIPQTKNQAELSKLYSSSDVFVCTSIEESAPLVVLEAMACGTPVVCFDSTGIPENIKSDCGKVVSVGVFEEFYKAIVYVAARKTDFSKHCICNIENEYTIEHMCKSYLDLYREILEVDNEH